MSVQKVVAWWEGQRAAFLLQTFYTFAKFSGMCPDINEAEYGEICAWLEALLPNTEAIVAWRIRTGRLHAAPTVWDHTYAMYFQPRLTYKTSLIAAFCLFVFLIDPAISITLGRATTSDAEATLDGIKTHIERNPTIKAAFGDLRARFSAWASEKITVGDRPPGDREATIDTTGLNTSKTGYHQDLVILDDLVNETNYESVAEMEKAWTKIQSFYGVLERWGTMIVVGTRWGENDVYGRLLEQEELRAENGDPPQWKKWIVGAYNDEGELNFPSVLPERRIEHLRKNLDEKLFTAWILNHTRSSGEDIFPLAYMQYVDGEFSPGPPYGILTIEDDATNAPTIKRLGATRIPLATILLIDPAPTVGPRSDFTGMVVVGFDAYANYWFLYACEEKELPDARLDRVMWLTAKYGLDTIAIENPSMDAVLLRSKIKSELGQDVRVTGFDPRNDRRVITRDARLAPRGRTKKEAQIEAMNPIMRDRRFFFMRGATVPLTRRMKAYPQVDHDDVLDAASMSIFFEQRLVTAAQIDPSRILEDIERREYALEGLDYDKAVSAYRERRLGGRGSTVAGQSAGRYGTRFGRIA